MSSETLLKRRFAKDKMQNRHRACRGRVRNCNFTNRELTVATAASSDHQGDRTSTDAFSDLQGKAASNRLPPQINSRPTGRMTSASRLQGRRRCDSRLASTARQHVDRLRHPSRRKATAASHLRRGSRYDDCSNQASKSQIVRQPPRIHDEAAGNTTSAFGLRSRR